MKVAGFIDRSQHHFVGSASRRWKYLIHIGPHFLHISFCLQVPPQQFYFLTVALLLWIQRGRIFTSLTRRVSWLYPLSSLLLAVITLSCYLSAKTLPLLEIFFVHKTSLSNLSCDVTSSLLRSVKINSDIWFAASNTTNHLFALTRNLTEAPSEGSLELFSPLKELTSDFLKVAPFVLIEISQSLACVLRSDSGITLRSFGPAVKLREIDWSLPLISTIWQLWTKLMKRTRCRTPCRMRAWV